MFQAIDQLPVTLKSGIVGLFPEPWRLLVSMLISAAAVVAVFAGLFALTTLVERKALGRMQNRPGPNRVGPCGLLQPLADGLKMLTKEDIVPHSADRVVHFLAPIAMVVPILLAYAVLPFGRNLVATDLDAGLLFFFAAGASTEVALFMAGWSSRNKYSLLGAMRAIAQMISYEVPLILSASVVVLAAGSLSLVAIVDGQAGYHWGWLARWNLFTPWGAVAFVLFLIAATAESNRSPFDLPEGESEIIAGHLVEYSGFKYALFFLGEYLGLFAVSGLGITLFLGGWREPVAFLGWVPSYGWFFLKLFALIGLFIWLRATLPRLRADQLMNLAWKFMVPMALLTWVVAAVWHFTAGWTSPLGGLARWMVCTIVVLVPGAWLSRGLTSRGRWGPRTYEWAES